MNLRTIVKLKQEVKHLDKELEELKERLEILSDPKFWAAVEDYKQKRYKQYKTVKEWEKELGV